MSRHHKARLLLPALALIIGAPLAALAGEGDHEPDDTHEHGPAYLGEARDIKGLAPLENVIVKGQLKGTMRFFIVQTDDHGRFRRAGLGLDVDANQVEFTCTKSGFRTVDVMWRRLSRAKDAPVEVECLLERD